MHEYRASSPRVLKCPLVWGVAVARGERAFYSPHFLCGSIRKRSSFLEFFKQILGFAPCKAIVIIGELLHRNPDAEHSPHLHDIPRERREHGDFLDAILLFHFSLDC